MSLEENNITAETDEDLNTTAPQSKSAPWTMPEPVFRCTSGKLPRGFEKQYDSEPETARFGSSDGHVGDGHVASARTPTPVPGEVVRPEPRPKSPTLKIVVLILGLVGMIGFLIAFLTVIYFFFLRSSD